MSSLRRPHRHTVGLVVVLPVAVLSLAAVSVSGWIRLAPDDPETWHQDPLTVSVGEQSNWYRLTPPAIEERDRSEQTGTSPAFDVSVSELAVTFDEVATEESRVEVLAGSATEEFVTYIQRSALMGYPDYISVRFLDTNNGGSTVAIYSRARYGSSDLGVNEKRVQRWVQETQQRLG